MFLLDIRVRAVQVAAVVLCGVPRPLRTRRIGGAKAAAGTCTAHAHVRLVDIMVGEARIVE